MIETIVIVLVVAIAGGLAFVATRPNEFRIERSIVVNAPAEKICALIEDFGAWPNWSPYEKYDPAMRRTRSGPAIGVGSVYEWQGNNKVGQGRMEILDVARPSRVVIKLDFYKPFEAHNTAEFSTRPAGGPEGGAVKLTWAMFGPSPFMSKLMGVFMNFDRMVGKDFEQGLANLKTLAEK